MERSSTAPPLPIASVGKRCDGGKSQDSVGKQSLAGVFHISNLQREGRGSIARCVARLAARRAPAKCARIAGAVPALTRAVHHSCTALLRVPLAAVRRRGKGWSANLAAHASSAIVIVRGRPSVTRSSGLPFLGVDIFFNFLKKKRVGACEGVARGETKQRRSPSYRPQVQRRTLAGH